MRGNQRPGDNKETAEGGRGRHAVRAGGTWWDAGSRAAGRSHHPGEILLETELHFLVF